MSNLANNENEELALINVMGFLVPAVLAGGAAWVAAKSAPAIAWLVSHGVLAAHSDAVVVPLGENAGLDMPRVIAAAALVLAVGFAVSRFRPSKGKNTTGKTHS
ncbi:hypothetical protein ACNHUS_35615 [Actinomycetes bacterium M1A6_2h]|uniref:hypothetical protein n=1 Tax=Kocuria marina TaxID=223184 RepID=UPI001D72C758|nr:hypothetical protein [Streptomyces sp. tea 10]